MLTRASRYDINMTEGKMLGNMIRYAIPIMLASVLQLLYNSADMFVLGNFCDDPNAIGAVGCTGALINLILGSFIGLGAGVCVTISHAMGSGDDARVSKGVHTSVVLALILGVSVGGLGYLFAPRFLTWMKTSEEFIEGATLYIRIYFCGSVSNVLYNFLSGILRSKGDTLHPLLFSSVGGVANILLNLLFVIVFNMGIAGVAIATIISQLISAVLSLFFLARLDGPCRISFRRLRLDRAVTREFIRYGLPAGVQGSLFSLSNVLLQSAYNSLGPLYVNANAAAGNVDVYIYNVMNAFYHVALTFASRNFGAGQYKRLKRVYANSLLCVTVIGGTLGVLSVLFAAPLIGIFDATPAVIEVGRIRLFYIALPYFLCGMMDIGTGMMRSIGHSLGATLITFVGSCLFRIVWVFTLFRAKPDIGILYLVYPISWLITFLALLVAYLLLLRRHVRRVAPLTR